MSNRITAYFRGRVGVTEALYQNDYGIVMNFDDIDLPAHFDCYFSTPGEDEAVPAIGADNMVQIPNAILARSGRAELHIPIHSGANDSEVEYIVHFKVIGRARPVDDGTPVQMTAIEQALALLQNPIGNIEQIVNEALAFTGDTFAEMQAQLDADQAAFKTEVRGDIADVESDFDNLNAQYQTAVAALTVDSEVQNVRVGADNVTYASAGEAVRTQFTNLKSDLDSTVLDDISLAWEQGSFKVADGAKQSASWIIRAQIDPSVESITPDSSSYASVIAFNGSTYVGWWNGSGFEKTELWYTKTLHKADYYVDGYTFWVVGKARNNAGINPTYSSHFTIKSNAITGIKSKLFEATSLAWEQGGFVIATGAKASYSYVIRCADIPKDVEYIYVPVPFRTQIFVYRGDVADTSAYLGSWDGEKVVASNTYPFLTGEIDLGIPKLLGYNIGLAMTFSDQRSITPTYGDYVQVYNGTILKSVRANSEAVKAETYGLVPNIIYQCRNVDDTVYPPYSKYYIQASAKNGYDRVRFNVRVTTDGYYFLCHDTTINSEARNMDGTEISGSVSATGKTLAELNSYDWGIKYGSKYAGMQVPLLEDALKYSAIYNLGVSLELSMGGVTMAQLEQLVQMFAKYGCLENLVLIPYNGTDVAQIKYFIDKNPRICGYVGAVESWWTDENIALVKTLQTPYNKVYVQLYPWGTLSTDAFIEKAWRNNLFPYNSTIMSESDLLNTDIFSKGYSLIEANNVYHIKDTIRRWADNLIK